FSPLFIGSEHLSFWKDVFGHLSLEEGEEPAWVILAPFVVSIFGLGIAYYYYIQHPELPRQMAARRGMLYLFLYNKWYFDELYDFLLVKPTFKLARILWKEGDVGIIDRFGPDGLTKLVLKFTRWATQLQSGYVYHYAFAMLVGVGALVTWFLAHGIKG